MGRIVEGLKKAFLNVAGKEVEGETKGEVFHNFNLYYVLVATTISVKDSAGSAIATPTIAIKKGSSIGSGDVVSAESDGSFNLIMGTYNYSVSKTGYITKTGLITIVSADAEAEAKALTVALDAPAVISFAVVDGDAAPVTETTIVVKTGEVIGSGTVVNAEVGGSYKCVVGKYNYSVNKALYDESTGTFEVTADDLNTTGTVDVVLTLTT